MTFTLIYTLNVICIYSKPKYISLSGDLNQYYFYANSGWDGNWYVGYNSCWIVKLPPVSTKKYQKAYIGAKLGRAKTMALKSTPWKKIPLEGKIFAGISQKPAFSSKNKYLIAENSDIPLENPKNEALAGAGNCQWFWTEVPINQISSKYPNYIAVWSPELYFKDELSSPIIAGAPIEGRKNFAWVNRSVRGTAPLKEKFALATPLNGISPAIVLKLAPKNEFEVRIDNFDAVLDRKKLLVSFSATGKDIYKSRVEISYDKVHWLKLSRFIFTPPYSFTIETDKLPKIPFFIRGCSYNMLENNGCSAPKKFR